MIKLLNLALKIFRTNNNKIVKSGNSRANKIARNLFQFKKLKNNKSKNLIYIEVIRELIFLISDIKKIFNYLRQIFIKTLIL